MKRIIWLGQAGLVFENEFCTVMVDPYLSDSVKDIEPQNYRRVPVDNKMFEIKPNILVFTHAHLDHYDPETVKHFLTENSEITVLSPRSVWEKVRLFGGKNNYILFDAGTECTVNGISFTAVKAVHSDPYAIGVLLDDGSKKYYVTGDTLYNSSIFNSLPKDIYAVFLPVNGVGNNMNMTDAARFVEKIEPIYAVPMHIGMFDNKSPNDFICDKKVIPEIYKEIQL